MSAIFTSAFLEEPLNPSGFELYSVYSGLNVFKCEAKHLV